MSQKDPAFKLFGRKIPLTECQIPVTSPAGLQIPANSGAMVHKYTITTSTPCFSFFSEILFFLNR